MVRNTLFYKAFPIHVGIIRGTTAGPGWQCHDGKGADLGRRTLLQMAMASANSGGIVIVPG